MDSDQGEADTGHGKEPGQAQAFQNGITAQILAQHLQKRHAIAGGHQQEGRDAVPHRHQQPEIVDTVAMQPVRPDPAIQPVAEQRMHPDIVHAVFIDRGPVIGRGWRKGGIGHEHAVRRSVGQQINRHVAKDEEAEQQPPPALAGPEGLVPADQEGLHHQRQQRAAGKREEHAQADDHGGKEPHEARCDITQANKTGRIGKGAIEAIVDRRGKAHLHPVQPHPGWRVDFVSTVNDRQGGHQLDQQRVAGQGFIERQRQRADHQKCSKAEHGDHVLFGADVGPPQQITAEKLQRGGTGILHDLGGIVHEHRPDDPDDMTEKQIVDRVDLVEFSAEDLGEHLDEQEHHQKADPGQNHRAKTEGERQDHEEKIDLDRPVQFGSGLPAYRPLNLWHHRRKRPAVIDDCHAMLLALASGLPMLFGILCCYRANLATLLFNSRAPIWPEKLLRPAPSPKLIPEVFIAMVDPCSGAVACLVPSM